MTSNNRLQPKTELALTLTFTSDWHVGQGAGRPGEVDRLIQRDADGLPYVPAKTLTGIWRDACEAVALGLDNGTAAGWSAWVDYLFGSQPNIHQNSQQLPRPAALSLGAARFSSCFRETIASRPALLAATTFIKPGIKIDAATGRAADQFLRFEEMARAGARLEATGHVSFTDLSDDDQQKTAYALLVIATRLIERLGGKRRRGAGRCQFTVATESVSDWIDWVRQHPTPVDLPPLDHALTKPWQASLTPPLTATVADWVTMPLRIHTQTPLVMAQRTLGNVVETLDYIPGTSLLRYVSQHLATTGVPLGREIATRNLLITNATLEVNGQPGYPTPFALFGTKASGGLRSGGTLYNRLLAAAPIDEQLKGERQGYIAPDLPYPKYGDVPRQVMTHNTIADASQRPTAAVGGVYSYEAIQPGTCFRAELRLSGQLAQQLDQADPSWRDQLQGTTRIGRSKKDTYGQVRITLAEASLNRSQLAPGENLLENPPEKLPENLLTVWLLSPLLLRDERLRPTLSTDAFTRRLSQRLGCALTLRQHPSQLSAMVRSQRIESWQVRWGLPRPSLSGFAAGSCFVFEYSAECPPSEDRLIQLEMQGLGERCAEGYGQLWFNAPLLSHAVLKPAAVAAVSETVPESSSVTPVTGLETTDIAFARIVEQAAWREAIGRAAEAIAATHQNRVQWIGIKIAATSKSITSQPATSQLGNLRTVLGQLQRPGATNLQHWVARQREKGHWSVDSLDKLVQLVTQGDRIWQILSSSLNAIGLPPFSQLVLQPQDEVWLQDQLWAEAVRTLVNTCIRAHKRELEASVNAQHEEQGHGSAA